jgi:hypothetical protein
MDPRRKKRGKCDSNFKIYNALKVKSKQSNLG